MSAVYCDGSRLVAEDLSSLHAFAAKIGIPREAFRFGKKGNGPGRPTHPHYPISSVAMVQKVLDAGAVRCSEHFAERMGRTVSNQIRMGTIPAHLWQ